jgi:diguanylate cyclase (GGDEF)-like protein/PAS domain S-box-containing protein
MGKNPTYEELILLNKKIQQKVLELTATNEQLRSLVDMLPQIVVETDLKGNLVFANQKAFESTGYTKEDFARGLNAIELVIPEEQAMVRQNMQKILNGEKLQGTEYTALRKDGSTYPVCVYSSFKIENGQTSGIRSIIIDITEHKKAEEKLKKASLSDYLTGLANRPNILQRLEYEKNLYERQANAFSIILCDIDHFKKVNDTYGHEFGDLVLKAITYIFPEILRKIDIASRWGGEEFLILLPASDQQGSSLAAERLRQAIEKMKIQSDNFFVKVTMSFGVATWKDTYNNIEEFIRQADQNLYRAKDEGRNRVIAS